MPNKNYPYCLKCNVKLTEKNTYKSVKRYCIKCQSNFTRIARLKWEKTHPIKYKAQRLMSSIRDCPTFKHDIKRDDVAKIIENKLNTECKYCGTILTLKNMSIDHRIPKSRNGSCDVDNLEVICAGCNRKKASLTDCEFKTLLKFLNKQNEDFKNIILARMAMAGAVYKTYGKR